VPTPKEIGSAVAISRRGAVAVAIGCVSASGRACVGDVLVMTVRSYRAVAGGPVGPLRVLFAYVDIPAGQTLVVRRKVPADVLHALRRARRFSVRVRVGFGTTASAVRRVKIG
jgi:hypothetical protein